MSADKIVSHLLPTLWVLWLCSSAWLTSRVFIRHVWTVPSRRSAFGLLLFVSLVLFGFAELLQARVDASGLMEVWDGTSAWKGAAGEALLTLFRKPGPEQTIQISRLFLIPLTFMIGVLVAKEQDATPVESAQIGPKFDGELFWTSLILLISPSLLFGVLGVFNFWFFPLLMTSTILAFRCLEEETTNDARLLISSSIALIGFSRPETIVVGVVLAILVVAWAVRKKDTTLVFAGQIALLLLAYASPSMLGYLGDRMRNQPLLMGKDTVGTASLWTMTWVAGRRVLSHLPLNLLALLLATHALGYFSGLRMIQIMKTRRAIAAEWFSFAFLIVEFLAISIHREGFIRYDKYGQLMIVPIGYLAIRLIFQQTAARTRWRRIALLTATLTFGASTALCVSGFGRKSLAVGRTLRAREADRKLLWTWTPDLAKRLCIGSKDQAVVVVVGLDEREENEKEQWESERWPLAHILARRGCATRQVYPTRMDSISTVLFSGQGLARLCEHSSFEKGNGPSSLPTHAIVTFYERSRVDELKKALSGSLPCAWELAETGESAWLLRRRD